MKGIDRCAQILANTVFLSIEPDTFTNAFETTLTPYMEHHLEANDVRILFDNAFVLVEAIECFITLGIEIRGIKVPICPCSC